ncbi:hypothetical protein ONS95_011203 [Cadophora gregata]|uniref:uncharacterized protein n=1 Tax=Cadophora gregata TaxID=51156 RepID=UPI0026DD22D4|nr:uncharacterized protein ONS95_011203 [Cadophora gregata]KAK0119769.1 hypothetical protein ONS95_011203 [Cadophora gregata]KAK0120801.1 hypothetical protein ONS96_011003 [Cadophora gregata f. sp. sojae]
MISLRSLPARGARNSISKTFLISTSTKSFSLLRNHIQNTQQTAPSRISNPSSIYRNISAPLTSQRHYSAKSSADSIIEEIQDQYAVARDEFEISTEETEKKSVYAQADREAAREELDKLKGMYEKALQGSDAEEIKSRIGNRIRELDHAVQALEESAVEH